LARVLLGVPDLRHRHLHLRQPRHRPLERLPGRLLEQVQRRASCLVWGAGSQPPGCNSKWCTGADPPIRPATGAAAAASTPSRPAPRAGRSNARTSRPSPTSFWHNDGCSGGECTTLIEDCYHEGRAATTFRRALPVEEGGRVQRVPFTVEGALVAAVAAADPMTSTPDSATARAGLRGSWRSPARGTRELGRRPGPARALAGVGSGEVGSGPASPVAAGASSLRLTSVSAGHDFRPGSRPRRRSPEGVTFAYHGTHSRCLPTRVQEELP